MVTQSSISRSLSEDTGDPKGNSLEELWEKQQDYNTVIRFQEDEFDPETWTQTYMTGLVSEFDEVLDAINWKRHRKGKTHIDRSNLAYELADLTKYIISMWEVWGFTPKDMLNYCHIKSDMLDQLLNQETSMPPRGSKVLICDIDGTLGDWRKTFIDWLKMKGENSPLDDPATSLMMDTDLSMQYTKYNDLKKEFERTGGYRRIYPYEDVIRVVREMQDTEDDFYLIVITARPADEYKRIWDDTWFWLHSVGLNPRELHIGAEPRILMANSLKDLSNVIMFEDNPGLALRAASMGIPVFIKKQPYNKELNNGHIRVVEDFGSINLEDFWIRGD